MLKVTVYGEPTAHVVHLEHSLVSLSKWESKHEKAFFGKEEKSPEEMDSYYECMVIFSDPPLNDDFVPRLAVEQKLEIVEYINSKQTATWFREEPNRKASSEVITSELIYYWLIRFQIPFTCETWHLNRLMTLIKVCGIKEAKPKKVGRQTLAQQYRQLNEQRRKELGTSG